MVIMGLGLIGCMIFIIIVLFVLGGCVMLCQFGLLVQVVLVMFGQYIVFKCGDILIFGKFSVVIIEILCVVGFDEGVCVKFGLFCIEVMESSIVVCEEDKCFSLVELWLQYVMILLVLKCEYLVFGCVKIVIIELDVDFQLCFDVWMQVVCQVYVYLFFIECMVNQCGFEDCQIQVCDYYNLVVQEVLVQFYNVYVIGCVYGQVSYFQLGCWIFVLVFLDEVLVLDQCIFSELVFVVLLLFIGML